MTLATQAHAEETGQKGRRTASTASARTRSLDRRHVGTALLLLPGLLFLFYWFILPIGSFLTQTFDNRELRSQLSATAETLEAWDGQEIPGEASFVALANDLLRVSQEGRLALLGARLNQSQAGFRPLVTRSGNALDTFDQALPMREQFIDTDARWGELATWQLLARESGVVTWQYGLAALDLEQAHDGSISRVAPSQRLFLGLFAQTVTISGIVTLACLLAGLPIAYVLAHGSDRLRAVLLVFVLLPFWTSLLVRSAGWIVVLQDQGLLNYALSYMGLGERATSLLRTRAATYIAMTHVLLPFMILPIFSVMRGVSDLHLKAAASLGAAPAVAFRRVYLPQILPGVVAGCTLVFVMALGYYITPMLVGGPRDQMISYFIAYYTNVSVNWGMAGALSLVLLGSVIVVYCAVGALLGFKNLRIQ